MKPFLTRWLPLLLWMAAIFLISADPNPYASAAADLGRPPAPRSQPAPRLLPALPNHTLGLASHLSEYILLGLLAAWALQPGRAARRALALAAALCILYSFSDEIHQAFVPGRAFELLDLGLDFLGSSIGAGLGLKMIPKFRAWAG